LLLPLPQGVTTGANDSIITNTKDATMSAIINSASIDDAMTFAARLGADKARGGDALPKLAIGACDFAAQGVLKPEHAEAFFTAFVREHSLTSIHDRSDNGLKANVSKLRQFINLGAKFGTDTLDDAARLYSSLHAGGADVKGAYVAYLDVARAQLKSDTLLDESDIEAAMLKGEAKATTEEAKLKQALKAIESAEKLRAEAGLPSRHELGDAAALLTRALTLAEDDRKHAEWIASRPVARVTH